MLGKIDIFPSRLPIIMPILHISTRGICFKILLHFTYLFDALKLPAMKSIKNALHSTLNLFIVLKGFSRVQSTEHKKSIF